MRSLPVTKAARLQPGHTVGVVAPASPISQSEIAEGLKILESFPLKIRLASHLHDRLNYLAGSDEDRLSDLHEMFSDPEVKAIFCARGGFGSARLLTRVDFELVQKNPKIIIGFSDLTALLFGLYKHTGLVTIHGPTLSDLPKDKNWENLARLISDHHKPELSLERGRTITHGKARGALLGGNFSTLCSLLDTPFLPSLEGAILFLEEKGEAPYRVDRMLTHLLLSGHLDRVAGLVIGQFVDCGEQELIDALLEDRLGVLKIPVVTGLPVGHGAENVALPLGLPALLDTERGFLTIEESCTL
jgi:muramoyltetrapeptide carboxypeptidase